VVGRKIVVGAIGILVIGAAPATKPPFEYKGLRAGEVIAREKLCRQPIIAPAPRQAQDSSGPKPGSAAYDIAAPLRAAQAARQQPLQLSATPTVRPPSGVDSCLTLDAIVAGEKVGYERIEFYNQKLSSVMLLFDPEDFSLIANAFNAKYGRPCAAEVKQKQNRMGAKFQSPHFEWCFLSGRLIIDMYGPSLDSGSAEYIDQNKPPVTPPKVDF
jgi:hypothetical protein